MNYNEKFMHRCIELARKGSGKVSPNPMVGSVIVHDDQIIGEGYHQKHGGHHAEVNAIHSVQDKALLLDSTIYVTLEPCAHFGLTPPCSDLIIAHKIPRVVIGSIDPFAEVAGKGIEKLKKADIEVITGVLKAECDDLNKRFFTYHQKKRPYIILKWAQTLDGFIDIERKEPDYGEPTWITGPMALKRVHEIRAIEDAIMVGTNTALKDNPSLTVRHCDGRNPVRIVTDRQLRLPQRLNLFDGLVKTIVFNEKHSEQKDRLKYVQIDYSSDSIKQMMDALHNEKILSVIVEGGRQLLDSFIKNNIWDEAHIFIGNKNFQRGIKAPYIVGMKVKTEEFDQDQLIIYRNPIQK